MTVLPNFLLIGAGKSGTSSLHTYLQQHPDVFMSTVKEPNFFALGGRPPAFPSEQVARAVAYPQIWRLDDYKELFTFYSGQTAIGESSTWYLSSEGAPAAIRSLIPEARLIAILRDPLARAFSAFLMNRRIGLEPETHLEAALDQQDSRRTGHDYGLDYLTPGLYARHLKRYLAHFPEDRLQILFYEDFLADEQSLLARIFRFIGVDPDFQPDTAIKHNIVGPQHSHRKTLCDRVENLVRGLLPQAMTPVFRPAASRAKLPTGIRQRLLDYYEADIAQLETLSGRDLGHWRQGD